MSVNEKMTAIADAIREKTETTDLLTLDEMAAAIAAIESDGGALNLTSIGLSAVECGSITPDSNTTALTISHGLNTVPKVILLFAESVDVCVTTNSASVAVIYSCLHNASDGTTYVSKYVGGKGNTSWGNLVSYMSAGLTSGSHTTTVGSDNRSGIYRVDKTSIIFQYMNGSGFCAAFLGGVTYKWILLV